MSDHVVRRWEALQRAVYAECARHGLLLDVQDPPIELCLCDGTEDALEVARDIMWWETTDDIAKPLASHSPESEDMEDIETRSSWDT